MVSMAEQMGAKRIVKGTKIPHPCGNPEAPAEEDLIVRRAIMRCALEAVQKDVKKSTVFVPQGTE
jgi:glycine reductase complex component B subunit gamma